MPDRGRGWRGIASVWLMLLLIGCASVAPTGSSAPSAPTAPSAPAVPQAPTAPSAPPAPPAPSPPTTPVPPAAPPTEAPGVDVGALPELAFEQVVPEPWRLVLLPRQTKPVTRFHTVSIDGRRVLRIEADAAYGKIGRQVPQAKLQAREISWRWRVDQTPRGDLGTREGDDAAMKVCVTFDWPMERLPALERLKLESARNLFGDHLPSAALCYVWHPMHEPGSVVASPYTRRMRNLVLSGPKAPLGVWTPHRRDLLSDFRRAFADEWRDGDTLPPLRELLVGADSDNTRSRSLGYVDQLRLHR